MKEQTIIKVSKKKILGYIVLIISVAVYFYSLLWFDNPYDATTRRRAILIFVYEHKYFFSVFTGIVFLLAIIACLLPIIRKSSYIIVDKTQVVDNSRIVKAPVLKWDDVRDVTWSGSHSPYAHISLKLKEDSEYLRTFPGLYGKFMRLIYKNRSFPLNFSTIYTEISGQEMYDIFRGYFANYYFHD